jgi:dTMP kinase
MKKSRPGRLIILEGGDGTGKTTQAMKLVKTLRDRGLDVLHLREPGSTDLGEKIRDILLRVPEGDESEISPLAEIYLYMAARAQLFGESIAPALRDGRCVVLERSYYSTYAYQGAGLGMDREMILKMGEMAVQGIRPDRVVLLDMDPAESLRRLEGARDRVESRDEAYHGRVRDGFLELARRFGGLFAVVAGSGSPDEVSDRVLEALEDVV